MADAAISGSLAGLVSMMVTFPLERIKTLKQSGDSKAVVAINEYFKGSRSVLETVALSNLLYFYCLEGGKQLDLPILATSTLAAVVNTLATEPFWKANTLLKLAEITENTSVFAQVLKSVRCEGWWEQWRGTGVSLWLVANPAIQYTCYEALKLRMIRRQRRALTDVEVFLLGAISKALATVLTYPLQVAQTRLRKAGNGYKGTLDCLGKVYNEEGVKGLFGGLSSKLMQSVLTAALMLLVYERILKRLRSLKNN